MSRFLQIRASELSNRVGYNLPTCTMGVYKQTTPSPEWHVAQGGSNIARIHTCPAFISSHHYPYERPESTGSKPPLHALRWRNLVEPRCRHWHIPNILDPYIPPGEIKTWIRLHHLLLCQPLAD